MKRLIVPLLVLYPALVYFLHDMVPAIAIVISVLLLLIVRLALASESEGLWRYPLLFVLCGVAAFAVLNVEMATLAYPVLMSLGFAILFGMTLVFPPTLIERLARRSEPSLPPDGIAYCRKVTVVWFVYCVVNAVISGGAAMWGNWELWSLWTGVLSYVGMGILFFGEMLLRKRFRRARA